MLDELDDSENSGEHELHPCGPKICEQRITETHWRNHKQSSPALVEVFRREACFLKGIFVSLMWFIGSLPTTG